VDLDVVGFKSDHSPEFFRAWAVAGGNTQVHDFLCASFDLAAMKADYAATQPRFDNLDRRIERIERRLFLIEARDPQLERVVENSANPQTAHRRAHQPAQGQAQGETPPAARPRARLNVGEVTGTQTAS
jgi:hypothetical protein